MKTLATPFLILLLLFTKTLYAQQANSGVIADDLNQNAASATQDWGKLVGNWNVVFEAVDEKGAVVQTLDAEWNWFYTLNGHAIQDVFILPSRVNDSDPASAFYGIGLRIFNEKLGKWQSAWIDTSGKRLEFREAVSTNEEVVLYQKTEEGDSLRITYFDMEKNTFEWKQEAYNSEAKEWKLTQLIHAKRN